MNSIENIFYISYYSSQAEEIIPSREVINKNGQVSALLYKDQQDDGSDDDILDGLSWGDNGFPTQRRNSSKHNDNSSSKCNGNGNVSSSSPTLLASQSRVTKKKMNDEMDGMIVPEKILNFEFNFCKYFK